MNRLSKALAAVMLMMMGVFTSGCNKPEDEPNNGGGNDGNTNTHAYVDLGLPSGTLWATCNVGATKPEEYGDYFAWGETVPKTTFSWSNYKYCNGSATTLTKYCNNSNYGYNGFTDNLTILLPEDDAATVNLGSDWSIPSVEQWLELRDNTTSTWTTRNGVNGRLFTALNGNSLFIPAAGGIITEGGESYNSGSGTMGNFFLNSINTENPHCAWYVSFELADCYLEWGTRCGGGISVRAVRSAK